MIREASPRPGAFDLVVVLVAIAVAIALRAWILSSSIGRVDGDEAVVGLMARGIIDGEHPVFFWGQAYGGSLEAGFVALVFAVLGPSALSLKVVPITLAAVTAVLLWRVARRVVDPAAAPFAGALFLLYPPAFVWWSTKERGFYWVSVVCVVAGLLLVFRIAQQVPDPRRADIAALGFVLGIGVWTSPQTLFVLAPALCWLLLRARERLAAFWVAVPALLVGSLPWIVWNAAHDFASLRQPDAAVPSTYLDRLDLFFSRLLPTALGVRRAYTGAWLFGPAIGVTLYVATLMAFAVLAMHTRRRWSTPLGALVSVAIAYPFLFAIPSTSYHVAEPRYALMLAPVIVLLLASALRGRQTRAVAVVLAALLAVGTVDAAIDVATVNPYAVDLVPPRLAPLERVLEREDIDRVYADYWIAYPLTFETDERIVASPVDAVRSVEFERAAAAAPRTTFVVFRDHPRDEALRGALDAHRLHYEHVDAGPFSVYMLETRVNPRMFKRVWALPSP
jgi:hypothetical protein